MERKLLDMMNQLSISEYNPRMEYCDLSEVNKVSVCSGNAYGFSMFYFLTVKIYTRIVHFGMKILKYITISIFFRGSIEIQLVFFQYT